MTIFEAFKVRYNGKDILETLDFGEAMSVAREAAKGGKRGIVLIATGNSDHYKTRGYWLDGIWFD